MTPSPIPFIALCRHEFVESSDSLAELLAILGEIMDQGGQEDVVVWQDRQVIAVVRADSGKVVHVRQEGGAA
jgi:hypothetical protein